MLSRSYLDLLVRAKERLRSAVFLMDWGIGVVDAPISSFLTKPSVRGAVRWILPPRPGDSYADPFGIVHEGRTWLFFEHYDRKLGRGVIAASEMLAGGAFSSPIRVLDIEVHAAYPFVFEHEGVVYCIPETGQANEIALYRADVLPGPWRKVKVLVEGFPGYDSTIYYHDGLWWLWSGAKVGDRVTKLFLWHAPHPEGHWTSHRNNPVKVDSRTVRCAGTPFRSGGSLYRPAQDGSGAYGARVIIREITRMTVDAYEERDVTTVEPDIEGPYPNGLHTLAAVGDLTFVDSRRWRLVSTHDMRRRLRRMVHKITTLAARRP
jgi:hypothetical protein